MLRRREVKELRLANRLSPFLPGGDSSLCTVVPPCTFIHRDADIFIGINIIASPRLKKKPTKNMQNVKGRTATLGQLGLSRSPFSCTLLPRKMAIGPGCGGQASPAAPGCNQMLLALPPLPGPPLHSSCPWLFPHAAETSPNPWQPGKSPAKPEEIC